MVTWKQIGVSKKSAPFPSNITGTQVSNFSRPGNLFPDGRVLWNEKNTRCLPEEFKSENQDLVVGPGELVINLTAQSLKDEFLGRVCMTGTTEYCLLNQRLAKLTPSAVPQRFMLIVFKSPLFRRFVDGLNTGNVIQHMFTPQIEDFTFPASSPRRTESDRGRGSTPPFGPRPARSRSPLPPSGRPTACGRRDFSRTSRGPTSAGSDQLQVNLKLGLALCQEPGKEDSPQLETFRGEPCG